MWELAYHEKIVMNDYYKTWQEVEGHKRSTMSSFRLREDLVKEYAWAIPIPEAISLIAKYSPIIEIGAGTGYWASLIAKAGKKIEAFDLHSPTLGENPYGHKKQFFPVQPIEWLKWEQTSSKTLMLCWPPYHDDMALRTLQQFRGGTLIYIGESEGGCNATDAFFKELDTKWFEKEDCPLPQWPGIYDHLTVYGRKD